MKDFWANKITFKITKGDEVYSPISFLVPFIGFINILKLPQFLKNTLTTIQKKKIKYSTSDKALTEIISIAAGCKHTLWINSKLKNKKGLSKMINIQNFPDQSTINRLLNSFTKTHLNELEEIHWRLFEKCGSVYQSKKKVNIDIDGIRNLSSLKKDTSPGKEVNTDTK